MQVDEKMQSIAKHIQEGAMAFLKAEYRVSSNFYVVAGILLGILSTIVESTHWFIVIALYLGAIFSALRVT